MGKPISLEKDLWKVGFDCLDHGLCITLPETNIAPENWRLKDDISFWDGLCSGAFAVSFREGISIYQICFKSVDLSDLYMACELFLVPGFCTAPISCHGTFASRESASTGVRWWRHLWWGQSVGIRDEANATADFQNFEPKSLGIFCFESTDFLEAC